MGQNKLHGFTLGMRVIQERSGTTPSVSYTRGTDLSGWLEGAGGIGGLLGRSSGYSSGNRSTHNFYHADGNGNITYIVNSGQGSAASYRYDPFGNTISSNGTLASANVYRFSSKEVHANSGMYYYLYRFYDPNLQRWASRDPLGETYDTDLYRFIYNAPGSYVDPDGMGPVGVAAGAGVGAVLGGAIGGALGATGGTLVLPGGGTIAGGAALGDLGAGAGAALGAAIGNAVENIWKLVVPHAGATATGSGGNNQKPPKKGNPKGGGGDGKPCPPPQRAGPCLAALMNCFGYAAGNHAIEVLCLEAHAACVATPFPVIFPQGQAVLSDGTIFP